MKLFRQLLVAPAALGLLAPISASAAEINTTGISQYTNSVEVDYNFSSIQPSDWAYNAIRDLVEAKQCNAIVPSNGLSRVEAAAIVNTCLGSTTNLSSLELKLVNEFSNELATIRATSFSTSPLDGYEAGGFSETTTLTGSAEFLLGATDGEDNTAIGDDQATVGYYAYALNLDTSFTGDDNLAVVLAAGNSPTAGTLTGALDFGKSNTDQLKVDDINYTRPFGDKLIVTVGDSLDLTTNFAGACVYNAFTDAVSNCGTANSAGAEGDVSISAAYDLGNGVVLGAGASGGDGSNLYTDQSNDLVGVQVAYEADSYGAAFTFVNSDAAFAAGGAVDTNYYGFNAYYTFGTFIDSISAGYEIKDKEADDGTGWMVGINFAPTGPGAFSIGVATNNDVTSSTIIGDGADEVYVYEASYAWDINDSMSASAGFFSQERTGTYDDLQGVALKTTFSF